MTFYLLPNLMKVETLQIAAVVADMMAEEGVTTLIDQNLEEEIQCDNLTFVRDADAWRQCDVIVTIGGDGTILHAARKTIRRNKPMLGINMGRLGFLTAIESDELDRLRLIAQGEYTISYRNLLQLECDGTEYGPALNDIVLFKESADKTIALDIYCDDVLVSSFRGDGVVFSTPTGSTAYSMSAGGPIVDAKLSGIIVAQICAHILQTPPMVFDASRTLRVVAKRWHNEHIYVSIDGMPSLRLPDETPIIIRQAAETIQMVQLSDADQLRSIDKKLKGRW